MLSIKIKSLKKYFQVFKRSSGLLPALFSVIKRPTKVIQAVDDITFEIKQGELVGFIGPNGAGKTTTLKCLSGLLYPSSGKISVLGYNPFERKNEFLKKISLVMGQKNQLWWDLPAIDTFKLNKEIYDINDEDYKNTLRELSNLLDVQDLVKIPTRQLSLGQRMKMELIAALIHKPKVLFLDEPTIGLDVVMQKKVREFISEYNNRFNATVLLTSHYMTDVKQLCKRIIIIDRGKIVYDGKLDQLVARYADYKFLSVVFSQQVNIYELESISKLISYDHPKAIFTIPRSETKKIVSKILQKYNIEDLNIEDPEIEDIIRIVFSKKINE